ncbi:hypothetical protein FSP39_003853 [Pinctada imbricata]|nr:hypothetical protein FSP39_003853 [Pinctada imbricata]
MEKIIRDRIVTHMDENKLFTPHQFGFRKGHSCTTQLIEVMDAWTKLLDEKSDVDIIYFDFQKAFDKVPHFRLLKKLSAYGIKGKTLTWIKEFLTDRKQRVILNGKYSPWDNITSGIPQGSVLGPILFLIYINDLPEVVSNPVKLFADDTKLYGSSNDQEDHRKIQQDINNLISWSHSWQLTFNKDKCKHLHLGRAILPDDYSLSEQVIGKIEYETDLGVQIDNQLKFQIHINTAVKKANRMLGVIKRNFKHLDKDSFLHLYKSLVRPHLEYASCAWYTLYKKDAMAIENTQRRATKLIYGIQHLSYSERLLNLGLPSLEYRRIRADVIQVYKYINNLDEMSKPLFVKSQENRTRGNSQKLVKSHCRLDVRKNCFTNRVINIWNSLPDNVVTANTLNSFKSKLNNHWKGQPLKFEPTCLTPHSEHQRLSRNTGTDLESRQTR